MKVLLYGSGGWIGGLLAKKLKEMKINLVLGKSRIEDHNSVMNEVQTVNPTHIILTTDKSSNYVISDCDYLELPDKIEENLTNNLLGPANIAKICFEFDIHLTYFTNAEIYGDNVKKGVICKLHKEEDDLKTLDSKHKIVLACTNRLLSNYDNCLILRINFPIDSSDNPNNNLRKLLGYGMICNEKMSISVLPTLVNPIVKLIKNEVVGSYNLVNPGLISHVEILKLYGDSKKRKVVTQKELNDVVISERCFPKLNTSKILKNFDLPNCNDALIDLFSSMPQYLN